MADENDSTADREERREHERARLIIDVFFDGKDATGVASTKDIGAGGLYLNTQSEIHEGAELLLRIPWGPKQIVVTGQVVYCNPGRGVGIKFRDLSADDRELIEG